MPYQFIVFKLDYMSKFSSVLNTMYSTDFLDFVKRMVKRVFITLEIDKFPFEDSTIFVNNATNSISIKS